MLLPVRSVCVRCRALECVRLGRCAPSPPTEYGRVAPAQTAPGRRDRKGQVHEPRPPRRQWIQPRALRPHPAPLTFSSSSPPRAFSPSLSLPLSLCFLPSVLRERSSATAQLADCWGGVARRAALQLWLLLSRGLAAPSLNVEDLVSSGPTLPSLASNRL